MKPQFIGLTKKEMVRTASGLLHQGDRIEAAQHVQEVTEDLSKKKQRRVKTEDEANQVLLATLNYCLNTDNYELGAGMLWTPEMFTPEPRCTQLVWDSLRRNSLSLFMGASSMSKTFGCGVFFYMDWLRDPLWTTVRVVGPSEDHLEANLFAHLVSLHRAAALPVPGQLGALFIGLDKRDPKSSIKGISIPLGRTKGAGKLQGVKRYPRKTEHPLFGRLTRLRVLVDEIEQTPDGIWKDFLNLTSTKEDNEDNLKIAGSFNPQLVGSKTYLNAEPSGGWPSIDADKDEEWTSKRGWHVVRLDAHKSENVIEGQIIYPGIQTREGLSLLAKASGGTDSPDYACFGRAMYSAAGTALSVIPVTFFNEARGEYIWYDEPKAVCGGDMALEGGDPAMLAYALFGTAVGIKYPPTPSYPKGRTAMFRDSAGRNVRRYGLQFHNIFELERGNTVQMATQVQLMCNALGLPPGHVMLDRTGNGAGIHDLLKETWAPEVLGVNYSSSSTDTKVMDEDQSTCYELYDRVHTELWYAFRRWLEFGFILFLPSMEKFVEAQTELTTRLAKKHQGKQKIETKPDYKLRTGGTSCNMADACCLTLHLVRILFGPTPSMDTERRSVAGGFEVYGGEPMQVRVQSSEMLDDLDTLQRGNSPFPEELDFMS